MASGGENYGYSGMNNTTEAPGWSNGNSFGNIGNTGEISAQAAQQQPAAPPPAPSPVSGLQSSAGGNYRYRASDDNNKTSTVSGWSRGNSFRNLSNTEEVGNGNKISAQSAQQQQSAPVPSPRSGVQPQSGGNYGYSASDDNNRNSVGNAVNISDAGVGNLDKILAQEQRSAPVQPPRRIGDNNGNIVDSSGVGNPNKISARPAQEQQPTVPPVPSTWSAGVVVQPAGGGKYGYSAGGDNKMGFSGWSEGNSVGNVRNAGVRSENTESTPRCSCCSFTMCS